ncbi:redox-sensing transcriptional repressor Rex [Saccharopolyspora mangrovi]|uniref:Redox-sensing transcriptional repressor Rex n=1 Tax=Saccharopolyspora mangrovi TaxID=3082379 RepID=A0ABU6AG53_9PSEU|nr:redox-sensing transcriptional repressor Rex [Saccharopolyspora sp. S2-29]MEB3370305.1 redox-sensing transcriptional repressor Rex [Saccharopolyspora sp. S2-29]
MTAQGADVPEGDGQATARVAASPGTPDANGADVNGAGAIEVPAARERARSIPEAAVARLAVYLRALSSLAEQDITTVSSEELATAAGVNSAKLRKDLSYIGSYGTRGVGYEVEVLIGQIERTLGLTRKHSVAVVGIGNLGHALANYGGFPSRGFPVSALFDLDDDLVGVPVGGIPVSHIDDIVEVCSQREVTIGVIATPTQGAQEVCDRLVAGGVTCILNFAPIVLQVPEHVEVRKVDLAVEMQILSFHVARRQQESAAAAEVDGASDGGPPGGGAGLPGEIDSANRMVERL